MKRLRFRFLLLIGWLVVFYNADRFLNPLNINDVAYILVLGMVALILASPHFIKVPNWVTLTVSIACLLTVKFWAGFPVHITDVVLSISEVFAIVTTALLTHWVNSAILDFERAVDHITIGRLEKLASAASGGESVIYREVRRARNHKRPLSVLAVSVEEKTIRLALDRIVKETQAAMAKHYALSGVSKILCNSVEDCDVIVQRDNHFLIVLPETLPQDMPRLIERLRRKVHNEIGVGLKIGMAVLPKDGMTFEGLIDKATLEMMGDQDDYPLLDVDKISSEHAKN